MIYNKILIGKLLTAEKSNLNNFLSRLRFSLNRETLDVHFVEKNIAKI